MKDILVSLVVIVVVVSVSIFLTVNGLYLEQLDIDVKKIITMKFNIKEKRPITPDRVKGRNSKKS